MKNVLLHLNAAVQVNRAGVKRKHSKVIEEMLPASPQNFAQHQPSSISNPNSATASPQMPAPVQHSSPEVSPQSAPAAAQYSPAPQAQPACVDDQTQTKTGQLIALCDKDPPLSASDIVAIQQLLAAGKNVACGLGQSE